MNQDRIEKDILLDLAEELAKELPLGSKNEMRRALRYFMQHRNYDKLIEMLRQPIPWYGIKAKNRWVGVRKALIAKKHKLVKFNPDQIAYIMGWASRLIQ